MKLKALRRFLKEPGGYRIVAGGAIVCLLALATLTGRVWTRYASDEMDLENLLVPPSVHWLKKMLTTEEGLRIQERNRAGARRAGEIGSAVGGVKDEDAENLDFLNGGTTADSQATASAMAGETAAKEAAASHWLGTDKNGRDMLSLLVAGAKNCFLPGLTTCAVALGLGVPLGLLAGYYGGRFRSVVRIINGTILSLPRLVLILVVICALAPNIYTIMGVLGLAMVPRVSELLATRVRILSNMGFILAAKEGGLSDFKILYRHLFWYQNRAVFFIQFSLIMAESILVETTLSYLQFGTKPPEVSWGNIIEGSQMSFFSGFYWITFFPAVAIILAILGFFYLGDGLNARLAHREGR